MGFAVYSGPVSNGRSLHHEQVNATALNARLDYFGVSIFTVPLKGSKGLPWVVQ
jgi:hypothetical protein